MQMRMLVGLSHCCSQTRRQAFPYNPLFVNSCELASGTVTVLPAKCDSDVMLFYTFTRDL